MNYLSTRGGETGVSAAAAIKKGIAADGGLYVPDAVPRPEASFIAEFAAMDYRQRATNVLALFLPEYAAVEIAGCVEAAYGKGKFDTPVVAPLVTLDKDTAMLELWHGPTSAFKDMALQLLPQLLTLALKKTGETAEIVILVATSGDTGKAALEGFRDVPGTRIIVFYPHEGVSEMQWLQMATQEGGNVAVVAVKGNFDDAQTGVKNIFNDRAAASELAGLGFKLSSANSINWGRLLPQIVYYFSAYADMVKADGVKAGQAINFVVPTGNFGNILAGYYAKLMGLPVGRLICAANSNNVLTEFLKNGVYDRRRPFHKTLSPSMDILISSNLERLLYHATGGDTGRVAAWMGELAEEGRYEVDGDALKTIQQTFWSDWASDEATTAAMGEVFAGYRYLADPHTAVAWHVCREYRRATGDDRPSVIVSTASPFKFNEGVLAALAGQGASAGQTGFAALRQLAQLTNWPVPPALADLEGRLVRHTAVCDKDKMYAVVKQVLKAKQ